MLFSKINIEPPNDTSTCCTCSRTSCCESLVTHELNLQTFQSPWLFVVFQIYFHQNSGSSTCPVKSSLRKCISVPQPKSLSSRFFFSLVKTIAASGFPCFILSFQLYCAKRTWTWLQTQHPTFNKINQFIINLFYINSCCWVHLILSYLNTNPSCTCKLLFSC